MGIAAQSGCGASVLRDIQNPNRHSPELPALTDFVLSKGAGSSEAPSDLNVSVIL